MADKPGDTFDYGKSVPLNQGTENDGPPIQGSFYEIIDGTPVEMYYRKMEIDGETRWVDWPVDLEDYYYANAPKMSVGDIGNLVVGMTPFDWTKDSIDLVAGKDVFTGEKQSFWFSLALIVGPEVVDQMLKNGKAVVKNVSQAVVNKKVGTAFETYIEGTKLKNVDFETQ